MTMDSRDPAYFEALYSKNSDPWNFESSPYERQKYQATIGILGERHFASALEVGCSIGVLTQLLAPICARLLAVDVVESALARARTRCASLTNIRFENRRMPRDWPAEEIFDLVVLSEVLYFLAPPDIERVAELACGSLAPGGCILLVNYTENIEEPCSGLEAAEIFSAVCAGKLNATAEIRDEKYRIDLLEK
jgi:predicted TPR repeat methyltransferase